MILKVVVLKRTVLCVVRCRQHGVETVGGNLQLIFVGIECFRGKCSLRELVKVAAAGCCGKN